MIDKKKYKEKYRIKVKSDDKCNEGLKKLLCIGVDGNIDIDTLLHKAVKGEDGETKLKKGKGKEHHLTFTKGTRKC